MSGLIFRWNPFLPTLPAFYPLYSVFDRSLNAPDVSGQSVCRPMRNTVCYAARRFTMDEGGSR